MTDDVELTSGLLLTLMMAALLVSAVVVRVVA